MQNKSAYTTDVVNKLITEVKKYPILFDQTLKEKKDNDAKNRIWAEISRAVFGTDDVKTIEKTKVKWKNLRDSFVKIQKKKCREQLTQNQKRNGPEKRTKPWRYEKEMKFLVPHITQKDSVSVESEGEPEDQDNDDEDDNEVEEIYDPGKQSQSVLDVDEIYGADDEEGETTNRTMNVKTEPDTFNYLEMSMMTSAEHAVARPSTLKTAESSNPYSNKRKLVSENEVADQVVNYLRAAHACDNLWSSYHTYCNDKEDATDSFFRGISKMVKLLSPVNQALVKKSISTVVMDAELREATEKAKSARYRKSTAPSSSTRHNMPQAPSQAALDDGFSLSLSSNSDSSSDS